MRSECQLHEYKTGMHKYISNGLQKHVLVVILGLFFLAPTAYAEDEMATTTPEAPSDTPAITVNLHVRHYDELAFEGTISVMTSGTSDVADNQGTVHSVPLQSALSAIMSADAASDAFQLSDLGYYASFDSFIINCVSIATVTDSVCYNWQYAVNDITPFVSVDHYILQENDDVYFYFGQQRRFVLSTTTVEINQPFTAFVEQYRYRTNEWQPLSGAIVGATQPNPDNAWTPFVLATSATDEAGIATFNISAAGTYNVGIEMDGYFPTLPITVTPILEISPPPISPPTSCCSEPIFHKKFNADKAVQFLTGASIQQTDGSILGSSLYSDWTALAFSSYAGNNPGKESLREYLLTDPNPIIGLNETADYARRSMALLSFGVNPYSGTKTNYIQKILDKRTGGSFGGDELYNDDIFVLFPLLHSGYTSADPIIVSTTAYILSKQGADGSWIGTDLTAAAAQALSPLRALPGVDSALERAKTYLRSQQKSDGGFNDNADSTSWALQSIAAFGETETAWIVNNNTPGDYLSRIQAVDGGMESADTPVAVRAWSTAFAIPAALGKTWNSILTTFPKPAETIPTNSPPAAPPTNNQPIIAPTPTTTDLIATSTLPIEIPTSTLLIVDEIIPVEEPPLRLPNLEGKVEHRPVAPLRAFVAPNAPREIAGVQIENSSDVPDVSISTTTEEDTAVEVAVPPETPLANIETAVSSASSKTQNTAKGVFAVAIAGAIGLGLYLGWKFLRGVI